MPTYVLSNERSTMGHELEYRKIHKQSHTIFSEHSPMPKNFHFLSILFKIFLPLTL